MRTLPGYDNLSTQCPEQYSNDFSSETSDSSLEDCSCRPYPYTVQCSVLYIHRVAARFLRKESRLCLCKRKIDEIDENPGAKSLYAA